MLLVSTGPQTPSELETLLNEVLRTTWEELIDKDNFSFGTITTNKTTYLIMKTKVTLLKDEPSSSPEQNLKLNVRTTKIY